MKNSILFLALSAVTLAPALANAAQMASVSLACDSDKIVEINLDGVTFMPDMLAKQGYSARVANGGLHLDRGNESILIGSLQKFGDCSYTAGMRTSFIDFTNPNFQMTSKTDLLSECYAVTTDGDYGQKEAVAITLSSLDSGSTMVLNSTFVQVCQPQ